MSGPLRPGVVRQGVPARCRHRPGVPRSRGLAGCPCVAALAFAFALALAWQPARAQAQPLAPVPPVPDAKFVEHVDAALPLQLQLTDAQGRSARLGDFFGTRPVILVLGYYRCPQLCGLLMHGVLEALDTSGLPRDDYRIVDVSIDPQDTPATARSREQAYRGYADFLVGADAHPPPLDLHLFTASAPSIGALARTVGFRYQPAHDASNGARFAHPAGFIVATPQGRIASYLMGVRFDAGALREAVKAAADGRTASTGGPAVGSVLSRPIALLCACIDPKNGRYNAAVMQGMRALALAILILMGWGFWQLVKGTRDDDGQPTP
jgi:protein SCO1/2